MTKVTHDFPKDSANAKTTLETKWTASSSGAIRGRIGDKQKIDAKPKVCQINIFDGTPTAAALYNAGGLERVTGLAQQAAAAGLVPSDAARAEALEQTPEPQNTPDTGTQEASSDQAAAPPTPGGLTQEELELEELQDESIRKSNIEVLVGGFSTGADSTNLLRQQLEAEQIDMSFKEKISIVKADRQGYEGLNEEDKARIEAVMVRSNDLLREQ